MHSDAPRASQAPDRLSPSLAGTLGKRLAKAGVDNTETNRRDYRELFYTAPGIGAHLRCRSIRHMAPQHGVAQAQQAQSRTRKLLANLHALQQRTTQMNLQKLPSQTALSAADGPG